MNKDIIKENKDLIKETISYLIVGLSSTVVNYGTFFILYELMFNKGHVLFSNTVSFTIATLCAFFANKYFVFKDEKENKSILKQLISYFSTRLLVFALEQVGLYISEHFFHTSTIIVYAFAHYDLDATTVVKVVLSAIAGIINYLVAKFVIFRKKKSYND